jgi:alpha-beta hydrolase superfamily lysophospholipase
MTCTDGAIVAHEVMEQGWSAEALAKLDWTDLAPARPCPRDGVRHEQGFLAGHGGLELYWQSWEATDSGKRRGRVLLQHGYGEHSARYEHVGVALVRAGYDVMALDARGHGKSAGVPAHAARYDEYVDDLELAKAALEARWDAERGPLYVLGHSNGGLIALRAMLRGWSGVAGYVVTSPMCGFAVQVPAWKRIAGDVMSKIWPTFALPTDLPPEHLTHDTHVVKAYAEDPLVRKVATARWFTEAKSAQADLMARAGQIKQPVLMCIAGSDQIVSPGAEEAVFAKIGSPDKTKQTYPALYHELLNEPDWPGILRAIILWMEARRGGVA